MKQCKKCLQFKPKIDFYKSGITKDGLRNECIICWNEQSRKYRKENPKRKAQQERRVKTNRIRLSKIKDKYGLGAGTIWRYGFRLAIKIYDKYNRQCIYCENENDLTLHHLDGRGRNYENQGLKANNNKNNLILICRKCHGRIHGKEGAKKRWKNKK